MRCYCCNAVLTDLEACRKFTSGDYTEMCTPCLSTISKVAYDPKQDQIDEEEDQVTYAFNSVFSDQN